MNQFFVDSRAKTKGRGVVRRGQAGHVRQAGAHPGLAGAVDDADVDQSFVGFIEEFSEGVLQILEATLGNEGRRYNVENGRVLGDQRVQAGRGRLVHEAAAIGQQQGEHHDLDDGSRACSACRGRLGATKGVGLSAGIRHGHVQLFSDIRL